MGKKFPVGSAAYVAELKKMLGGTNGLRTALQLTGSHMDAYRQNVDAVTAAYQKAGGNVEGWAKVQADLSQQMDVFKAQIEVAAIDIGSKLIPPLSKVLGFLEKYHLIIPILTGVAGLLTAALIAQAAAWALTPFGQIAIAIAAVTAALTWLVVGWDKASVAGKALRVVVSAIAVAFAAWRISEVVKGLGAVTTAMEAQTVAATENAAANEEAAAAATGGKGLGRFAGLAGRAGVVGAVAVGADLAAARRDQPDPETGRCGREGSPGSG